MKVGRYFSQKRGRWILVKEESHKLRKKNISPRMGRKWKFVCLARIYHPRSPFPAPKCSKTHQDYRGNNSVMPQGDWTERMWFYSLWKFLSKVPRKLQSSYAPETRLPGGWRIYKLLVCAGNQLTPCPPPRVLFCPRNLGSFKALPSNDGENEAGWRQSCGMASSNE